MREFNLDLLISRNVAVNCKTVEQAYEFLKFLEYKGIKWCDGTDIFKNKEYYFALFKENTCFSFHKNKGLQFECIDYFRKEFYEILSFLDDLAIKTKNNFKEYGFEADFEGAILSDIEDYYIGYYVESYPCIKEKQKIPTFWNKNTGNCYKGAGVSNSKFSLKPIKKEWYEKPDNFPCIATKDGKNFAVIESIDYLKRVCIYPRIIDFRPATKEEVLSLLVKE